MQTDQNKEEFLAAYNVPRETKLRLERYASLLIEWNERFNLVAKSTIPDLWKRHFLDSAQLYPLLPAAAARLIDLGSGAGFPGLILSILGVPEVHLVESTGKKARFLEEVARELGLNVSVHNERIEKLRDLKTDVVTARALTALPELLSLAKPFMEKESVALFLKGGKVDAELTEARKYWTFSVLKKESQTDPSGAILCLRDLKVRHDSKRKHKF